MFFDDLLVGMCGIFNCLKTNEIFLFYFIPRKDKIDLNNKIDEFQNLRCGFVICQIQKVWEQLLFCALQEKKIVVKQNTITRD